jgi:hypothetical protein
MLPLYLPIDHLFALSKHLHLLLSLAVELLIIASVCIRINTEEIVVQFLPLPIDSVSLSPELVVFSNADGLFLL